MAWLPLPLHAVGLAPMAGITDSPFRKLCRAYSADFVLSEMISAAGICHKAPRKTESVENRSLGYARFEPSERPIILQIFGHNPDQMALAAKTLIAQFHPDGIDINMGCPARKVIKSGSGCVLMDQPDLACQIVRAVKSAIGSTPLSVKTRLGNTTSNILELAPRLQHAGIDALIIHGRLRRQGFSGPVDYQTIAAVAKKISVPVIANGGIKTALDAKHVFCTTHSPAILIGQAARGNPFIFKQIKKNIDRPPSVSETVQTVLQHTAQHIQYRGQETGAIIEMRKHYGWYFRGIKNAAQWRQKLMQVRTLRAVKNILLQIDRRDMR